MAMRTEPPIFDAKMYTNGVDYTSVDTNGNVLYTGINAVTVFNSTVLYLHNLGGGLLLVLGGVYLKTGSTAFTFKNFVNVEGVGWKTIFKNDTTATGNLMECISEMQYPEPTGFQASHFMVHGNRDNCAGGTNGIYIYDSPECTWQDLWIGYNKSDGIHMLGISPNVCDESNIERNYCFYNTGFGIWTDGNWDLVIRDNTCRGNGDYGTWAGGGIFLGYCWFSEISGNRLLSNFFRGGYFYSVRHCNFNGNFWRNNNGEGLAIQSSLYNEFDGDVFDLNSRAASAYWDGCKLYDGCHSNTFIVCSFVDRVEPALQRVGLYDGEAGNSKNKAYMCTAYGNANFQILLEGSGDQNLYPNQ